MLRVDEYKLKIFGKNVSQVFDTCHVYNAGQTRSIYILSTHLSQAITVLPSD